MRALAGMCWQLPELVNSQGYLIHIVESTCLKWGEANPSEASLLIATATKMLRRFLDDGQ